MQEVDSIPIVKATREYSGGMFHSGVVQYAVSFYNRNAQETPILAVTNLEYISHPDRGEEPDRQVGCCFEISLETDSARFDYARVYQIYRSSVDTVPQVKVIRDIKLNRTVGQVYRFVDTNEQGYDFDAYRLLIPQTPVVADTFVQKDQKLFEGAYRTGAPVTDYMALYLEDDDVDWT